MTDSVDTYSSRLKALKCVVIIPTYNNAGTIARVIADVRCFAEDVMVVNDGSTDDSQSILESIPGIRIVSYQKNMGKGHALRTGLEQAYSDGYRYALTIDADGQHFADDIPAFIDRIEEVPDSPVSYTHLTLPTNSLV